MFVTFLFDVEDLIAPEADTIARSVAECVSEEGAAATFCIVGERARQWQARGRRDVIDALARHDIGFHTTWHSVHPTIMEYLADKGWDDGVEEVLRRERSGVEAIEAAFGRLPSCYGGPGNTWGPQVNEAMRRLGVPAVVYSPTWVPGDDVHEYCGAFAYPCGCSVGDGDYHLPDAWARNLDRVLGVVESARKAGTLWLEVFMGHPTRILHEEFWDGPNFSQGKLLPREQWVKPRRKPDADVQRALGNLRRSVRAIADAPGVRLRTIRQMNDLLRDASRISLTEPEMRQAAAIIDENVSRLAGWVIHRPDLDVSRLRQLTAEQLPSLRRLVIDQSNA
jgi:hypothetical protein